MINRCTHKPDLETHLLSLPFCPSVIALALTNIYCFCLLFFLFFFCRHWQLSEHTLLSANSRNNSCLFSEAFAFFCLCSLLILGETGSITSRQNMFFLSTSDMFDISSEFRLMAASEHSVGCHL